MTRTEAADKAGVSEATMERAMKVDRSGAPELVVRLPRHSHGRAEQWPRVIQGWCVVQNILKLFQLVVVQ
jgi:hypothetical protein